MTISLRKHQVNALTSALQSWQKGNKNVCVVLPTGAGKTLVMAQQAEDNLLKGIPTVIFAHRDVLIGQISAALCLKKVFHSFIASKGAIKEITNENLTEFGNSFYNEHALVTVISVDTYLARTKKGVTQHFAQTVGMWMMDETHHLLEDNKWGQCVATFPNALGLGVTATPIRSDGKGLGRHTDGVFDDLQVGATMGELISATYLAPYKIFVPPTRLDLTGVNVTGSGDYNQKKLAKATDKSDITGDVVEHYLKLASGQQAITFCVNIEHSKHVAAEFNRRGVTSKALSSKTPMAERNKAIRDFRAGKIINLVNADLFGEGFDVPAVACCIMLRKTQSYSLFKQQFGRALRPLEGKTFGILIDHVGNVPDMLHKYHLEHPHDDPEWTLDRKQKRASSDDGERPKGKVCPECMAYFVPVNPQAPICSECGHAETKQERLDDEKKFLAKEGELVELESNFVSQLMVERSKVDKTVTEFAHTVHNLPAPARSAAINKHAKRQHAQNQLRRTINTWCHQTCTEQDWDIKTTQAEFHRVFNMNIFKAQTLSEREAIDLHHEIFKTIKG